MVADVNNSIASSFDQKIRTLVNEVAIRGAASKDVGNVIGQIDSLVIKHLIIGPQIIQLEREPESMNEKEETLEFLKNQLHQITSVIKTQREPLKVLKVVSKIIDSFNVDKH